MSLELKQISKIYGKKTVLNGLNLTLEEEKIYGLIGRNGAGKTTMLSIASAQNPTTAGEVLLDGEKVWENRKALQDICFSRELAKELVAEFGLDENMKIYKLSKGMQSMVTIIVAMASGAKYTFLDEPVTGLDVVAREAVG